MNVLRTSALAAGVLLAVSGVRAGADESAPGPGDLTRGCTLLQAADASRILGEEAAASEEGATMGAICTFAARSVADNGVLSYSVLDRDAIVARSRYFAILARRCANVAPSSPNFLDCGTYRRLSTATTANAYYLARAERPDVTAIDDLGDRAVSTGAALVIERGDDVFECSVHRADEFDLAAATTLARELLERVPWNRPPAARRSAKPSPRAKPR